MAQSATSLLNLIGEKRAKLNHVTTTWTEDKNSWRKDEPLQADSWDEKCGGEPGGRHSSLRKRGAGRGVMQTQLHRSCINHAGMGKQAGKVTGNAENGAE